METLEFLYRWKYAHIDPQDCFSWAEHLIKAGRESRAVLMLLGSPEMQGLERDHYIRRILDELGIEEPADDDLVKHQEHLLILRYLKGEMTVTELTAAGEKLWIVSGYNSDYLIWAYLDEDSWNLSLAVSDKYRQFFYLDPDDVDGSLRACLEKNGKMCFLDEQKQVP